jgi:hypothetical protein
LGDLFRTARINKPSLGRPRDEGFAETSGAKGKVRMTRSINLDLRTMRLREAKAAALKGAALRFNLNPFAAINRMHLRLEYPE